MKLAEYLAARGESESSFARRAFVAQSSVNLIARGGGCRAATAIRIVRASSAQPAPCGGTISFEDLGDKQTTSATR